MTGSVVLPVKALLMNLLTLSAAFGLLVLIFQDGRLEGLLAFDAPGRAGVDPADPAVRDRLRALDRLRRVPAHPHQGGARRRRCRTARRSPIGLERTGRIVTDAALLFCIAIGAFATSEVVFIKELGIGTALAVLIDATIVRALLVPSLMALLGRWNWWAPRPLARLHARLRPAVRRRDALGYLGLGSNVGDRRANLQAAVEDLWTHDVVGARLLLGLRDRAGRRGARPADFYNACVRIETALEPEPLLDACKAVERALGREPGAYGTARARSTSTCCCSRTSNTSPSGCALPHREVTTRRFVLVPLLELDPGLELPGGGRVADALAALGPGQEVRRAGPPLDVRP